MAVAQHNSNSAQVLWLDDLVDQYRGYIAQLGQGNVHVTKSKTVTHALQLATEHDYDLYLVDLRLQNGTGVDFIVELTGIKPGANICILSSYAYLPEYRSLVERTVGRVSIIEKDIPSPSSARFELFSEQIRDLASTGASKLERGTSLDVESVNPFSVSYFAYGYLSPADKDRLHIRAHEKLRPKLNELFESGVTWTLFMGDENHPMTRVFDDQEIWSDDQIEQVSKEHNRIPYQFRAPIETEDFGVCGGALTNASYPYVSFAWVNAEMKTKKMFGAHFDTGSYKNYLSYEHWLQISGDPNPGFRSTMEYRRRTLIIYDKTIQLRVQDQIDPNNEVPIDLSTILVKDWIKSPFIMNCPRTCSVTGRDTSGFLGQFNCKRRYGLIGRRLIIDNGLTIHLHPDLRMSFS